MCKFSLAPTLFSYGTATVVIKSTRPVSDNNFPSPVYAQLKITWWSKKLLKDAEKNIKFSQNLYVRHYDGNV